MWALLGRPAVVHQDFNPPHDPSPQYGTPSNEQIQYMLADFRLGCIPFWGEGITYLDQRIDWLVRFCGFITHELCLVIRA